ncbi:undecaprenyl-phosphate glucose phosphotransferase [Litoribrevibacter albus]|uniref:Undecaprenyl-phosphate glucose phosphotransferase n=1 Tax=Litoribrevibacter albus TaxID=1473156 RepID=A0AA37S726_9GAMM|nr:undecaprenyl-phosphate glucose phosphotransferase [Litoribrevibacter albus]GLQ30292.1 undecaprenyl-phosphate glucose phosphotransferase [Litoribrevibacter albus]
MAVSKSTNTMDSQTKAGMIKPYASKFVFISRALDSSIVIIALGLVGLINFGASGKTPIEYWVAGLLAALIYQVSAEFTEIFRSWRSESLWAEAKQVILCWTTCFAVAFCIGRFSVLETSLFSWPQFFQWYVFTLSMLLLWRLITRIILRQLRIRGYNTRSVAIVGTGGLAQQVASRIKHCTWGGYRVTGFYDDRNKNLPIDEECRRASGSDSMINDRVGGFDCLVEQAESGELDSIFIALPMRAEKRIQELLERLSNSTASVYVVPDLFVFELLHARTINLNGLPAFGLIGEPMSGLNSWVKRVEDIIGASLILSLIAIPMLLIALGVKLTSRGPVIFKQHRYGLDGRPIQVYKFRSMTVCENSDVVTQASKNDARITAFGGFLRKTSLDELPQFINVLQGRMSIVGPRPHAVAHNEEYRVLIPGYMRRHKIKPGITGWAQVNGWRGETDTLEKMEKRIEHDLHYIHHWTIWWDVKIIIKTVFKGFTGKNAY